MYSTSKIFAFLFFIAIFFGCNKKHNHGVYKNEMSEFELEINVHKTNSIHDNDEIHFSIRSGGAQGIMHFDNSIDYHGFSDGKTFTKHVRMQYVQMEIIFTLTDDQDPKNIAVATFDYRGEKKVLLDIYVYKDSPNEQLRYEMKASK